VTKTVNLSPKSDWYVVPGSTKMLIHVPLGEIRYWMLIHVPLGEIRYCSVNRKMRVREGEYDQDMNQRIKPGY